MQRLFGFLVFVLFGCGLACGAEPAADASKAAPPLPSRSERMQWWREARFGMFIHWGPVSLKGTEISWSRANSNPTCPNKGPIPVEVYDNLYKEFNPVKFSGEEWVAIAKAAGMKYMVLTAKHCDGFLLWDSKVDDYNIMHTPFKRDVCGELTKAAHEAGMRIGWYFSPMDWRDPDFRTERNTAFVARMQGEIRELLTNYGPIDVLWFDWDGRKPVYDQATTYALVKELQPKIILTNRLDLGEGNSDRQILSPFADYYTPEQSVGAYDDQRPWETCLTLGTQWSWKPNDTIKSLKECIDILVRCAGGDGNLLLNVGPMPTGEIEPRQADVLKGMGAWLAKYGETIYSTRGGPWRPGPWGAATCKGNTVYVHILQWPGDKIALPALTKKIVSSKVLTGGTATVKQTDGGVEISVPAADRQELDTIVVLTLDGPASEIKATTPDTTAAAAPF
jgi:alpha-L-fucosidase